MCTVFLFVIFCLFLSVSMICLLLVYIFFYLSVLLSICLVVFVFFLFVCLVFSDYLSVCLSACRYVCLSVCLFVCLLVFLSVFLSMSLYILSITFPKVTPYTSCFQASDHLDDDDDDEEETPLEGYTTTIDSENMDEYIAFKSTLLGMYCS